MQIKEAMKLVEECGLNIEGVANIECESIILSALEKQIPTQAQTHGERNREVNSISYTCPVCKSHVDKCNYCSNCGQAIIFEKLKNENDVI